MTQDSPFLRLPGELRNAIYTDLIVREPSPVVIYELQPDTHSTVGHPLTQTCRQLRNDLKLYHESEGPAWAPNVYFICRNIELYNLRNALARLVPVVSGIWRTEEVQLLVDHDTFRAHGHVIRSLVWNEGDYPESQATEILPWTTPAWFNDRG